MANSKGKSADDGKLDTLIGIKSATTQPNDGRLQVALAISSLSSLVSVDTTKQPFETDPDDLFDRQFNDPKVGIDDSQMQVFKATLAHLLPSIAGDIAHLPENSNSAIEKVAEFVRLALLAQNS